MSDRPAILLRADRLGEERRRLGVVPHGGVQLFLPAPGVTAVFRRSDGEIHRGPVLAAPHTAFTVVDVIADGPVLTVGLRHAEARRALRTGLERFRDRLVALDRRLADALSHEAFRGGADALDARLADAWPVTEPCEATWLAGLAAEASLAELQDRLGVGARHVQRLFLSRTGLAPSTWRLLARVHAARAELHRRPEATITEIALAAGFHDQAHFTKAFRRLIGITPARCRRMPIMDVVSVQDGTSVTALPSGVLDTFS